MLKNIVNIFEVTPLKPLDSISLELMLMKVRVTMETRSQILQMITAFEGVIIEMNCETVSFRVVGSDTRLDGIISVFREFDIIELARTGEAAIHK